MAIARCQVNLPRVTSIPEDTVVNTWHFRIPGDFTFPAQLDACHAALVSFYQAIDLYLSADNKTAANMKWYNLDDPKPRQPVRTDNFSLTLGTGPGFPEEVAMCLSFQADAASGQNQKRRRGRIFLGPLAISTSSSTGGRTLISTTVTAAVAAAGGALLAASTASADWEWVVFSPTTHAGGVSADAASYNVGNGWVDNAFDTQRRRGPAATTRVTFT